MANQIKGRFTHRLIPAAIVAALLLFFGYAFMPRPIPVDMAEVARGPMQVALHDEGYTRVRDVYVLSAPVSGRLMRIEARVGDAVVAGETLLARLMPSDAGLLDARSRAQAEASVGSAEAALTLARAEQRKAAAELEYARAEVRRARHLESRDGISKSALDRAELALKTARAALDTARAAERMRAAELENAKALLLTSGSDGGEGTVPVIAPISGRILRLVQESETVVAAGSPLLELGDPAQLEVVVDLLSRDAVKVHERAEVSITGWGGEQVLTGRVRRVEPYGFTKVSALGIEEQRVNIIIEITTPYTQWQGLGHGYRVDAAITVWQSDDVLQVPTAALLRQAGQWSVYRVVNNRAEAAPVILRHNNGQMAEILEGLDAGTTVILHPSERIDDGIRLELREY